MGVPGKKLDLGPCVESNFIPGSSFSTIYIYYLKDQFVLLCFVVKVNGDFQPAL